LETKIKDGADDGGIQANPDQMFREISRNCLPYGTAPVMHNSGKSGRIVAEVVGSDLNQQLTSSDKDQVTTPDVSLAP
jgi:hypothetical protein